MTDKSEKYNKVIGILRSSKPEIKDIEAFEQEVINAVRRKGNRQPLFQEIIGNIFGWIYIGWVRRSLVAASILLLLFFVYQQTIILRGVNNINKLSSINGNVTSPVTEGDLEKRLLILRLTGRNISSGSPEFSEEQLRELIKSYNELQQEYSGLLKIIEEDPALKKYIEKKLEEHKENNMKPDI